MLGKPGIADEEAATGLIFRGWHLAIFIRRIFAQLALGKIFAGV